MTLQRLIDLFERNHWPLERELFVFDWMTRTMSEIDSVVPNGQAVQLNTNEPAYDPEEEPAGEGREQ